MRRFVLMVAMAGAVALGSSAFTGDAYADEKVNRARSGLALKGYDVVAYFAEGTPVVGQAEYEIEYRGTRYRFTSAANRERFSTEPERYLPQYGGFCSYAVSRGYTADVDPLAWAIVGDKLYLNYSKRVQQLWQEDVPGNIRKADGHWPRLRDSK